MLDPDQFLVGISKSFLWDLCLLCLRNFGRLTPGLGPFAEEHAQSIAEKLHQEHQKVVQQRKRKTNETRQSRCTGSGCATKCNSFLKLHVAMRSEEVK